MDTLTDTDRARLDREWAFYSTVVGLDGGAALARAWLAGLPPSELAYVQAKLEAVVAPLRAWWDQWASAFAAWWTALHPPPARARHARAVHKGARR